ncbi:MAG: glycosyltransferase family 2 protein [Lachnospiraceae bacterium]|nr:glycosyltransferase family 2 protein [Lachnospiraceae bacterium]
MKDKQVTIIIPNYNGLHYLDGCLKSIFSIKNWEDNKITHVIIVDNGSTDGSVEYLKTYPEIDIIRLKENTGFSHAVNTGIKKATTEYVILLNNDTAIVPGFVGKLIKVIEKDKLIFSAAAKMLVMGNPQIIDNAGDFYNVFGWAYARGKGKGALNYGNETAVFSACAGAAIYRRKIIEELGYFDEAHFAYFEDVDIGYAARLAGYKNRFCPTALVDHAGSASSGSRYNKWKTGLASSNSIYLIYKNMPGLQIILNLPFLLTGFLIKLVFFSFKGLGFTYLAGLVKGLKLSFSAHARRRKIRFRWKNLKYYLVVQWELYLNVFRMFR